MTVLDMRIVKARKNHRCDICGLRIPAGVEYMRNPCIDYGDFYDNKYHIECHGVAIDNDEFDDFFPEEFRSDHEDDIDFKAISTDNRSHTAGERGSK